MPARTGALLSLVGAIAVPLVLLAPWAYVRADGEYDLPRKEWSGYNAYGAQIPDVALVVLAAFVAIAAAAWLVRPRKPLAIACLVLGLGITGLAIALIADPDDALSGRDVHTGWGAYAGVSAGVLIAAGGAVAAFLRPRFKRCPDCASRMRVEARVCLKCGYREQPAN